MALLNLAVNARDAMDEGVIRIVSEDARVPPKQLLGRGSYVCLSVIDNGSGMDEATLARAQEPFFTTKGTGRGTGLGLAMVSGFAEQSGGTLWIESEIGKGTRVDIWLPVSDTSALPGDHGTQQVEMLHDTLGDKVVVIVDDEPPILINSEAALLEAGAHVYPCSSAVEALELVRRHPGISCVVTDYAMPGMTGAQLAAAIHLRRPDIPIVVATGYAEVPEEIGRYPRLQKPFTAAGLVGVVTAAVSGITSKAE
jgi:CheY-like chemotaxis protein